MDISSPISIHTEGETCYELWMAEPSAADGCGGDGDQEQERDTVPVLRRICGDDDLLHGQPVSGGKIHDWRLFLCAADGLLQCGRDRPGDFYRRLYQADGKVRRSAGVQQICLPFCEHEAEGADVRVGGRYPDLLFGSWHAPSGGACTSWDSSRRNFRTWA